MATFFTHLTSGNGELKWERLMELNATHLGTVAGVNFYEHPTEGDEAPIIATDNERRVAAYTGFWDMDSIREEASAESFI